MKNSVIICLIVLCLCSCGTKKLSELQKNNIKTHLSDVDLSKGVVWFYDLNEDGRDEVLIPEVKEIKEKYFSGGGYSLNVFDSSGVFIKKIFNPVALRVLPEQNIYVYKISKKYLPVLFYACNDADSGFTTTSYWTMDGKLEGVIKNEPKVTNEIVFYSFDREIPTFVQLYFGAKCSYVIYKMDRSSKDPVILESSIIKFEKLLSEKFPEANCSRFTGMTPTPMRGSQRPVSTPVK